MTKNDIDKITQIVVNCFVDGVERVDAVKLFSALMQKFTPEITSDMFWNFDDSEVQYVSIGALLLDALSEGWLEENSEVDIIQAKKCNPIKIKVTSITDYDIDWEVIS